MNVPMLVHIKHYPARKGKRKKEEYLYIAILADTPLTKRSDMDHTVLPANYTMSAIAKWGSSVLFLVPSMCVCVCLSVWTVSEKLLIGG